MTENEKLYKMFKYGVNTLLDELKLYNVEIIENKIDENEPDNNIVRFQDENEIVYSIVQRVVEHKDKNYAVRWILQNAKKAGIKLNLVNLRRHDWIDYCTNLKITEKEKYHWYKTNDKLLDRQFAVMKVYVDDDNISFMDEYRDTFSKLFCDVKRCTNSATNVKMTKSDEYSVKRHEREQLRNAITNVVALEEPHEQLKELFDSKYFKLSAPNCASINVYDDLHIANVDVEYIVKLQDQFKNAIFAKAVVVATVDIDTLEVKYDATKEATIYHTSEEFDFDIFQDKFITLHMNLGSLMRQIYNSEYYSWTKQYVQLQNLNNCDCKLKQTINACANEFQRLNEILEKLK